MVDVGSYETRAGYSLSDDPLLRFRTQVAKPKTLLSREIDALHIVGNEFSLFESSKLHKKSLFDKNIITHTNALEHIFDYCFSHLGIPILGSIKPSKIRLSLLSL